MPEFGYALSSEEHNPINLVRNAVRAEEAGFTFALISDHYHPWVEAQGHAPFVWSIIGGIANATSRLRLGTGVTCPSVRIHPAIIAQAAATTAALMPGRFFLGLGSGENLNEHVLGDPWPEPPIRLEMLEEAVEIIRELFEGEETSHWGEYFTVDRARLFTLPDELPPIYIAAAGKISTKQAGEIADGFISIAPEKELVEAFEEGGGSGKPKLGKVTFCWAESQEKALDTVYRIWPNAAVPEPLSADLPTVDHFEAAIKLVRRDDMREQFPLGPEPEQYINYIQKYFDAGFDQVYLHQIGPDQEGFFRFFEKEIYPHFKEAETGRR
jgi:G6PDH family F420-dependent oxidoreductase